MKLFAVVAHPGWSKRVISASDPKLVPARKPKIQTMRLVVDDDILSENNPFIRFGFSVTASIDCTAEPTPKVRKTYMTFRASVQNALRTPRKARLRKSSVMKMAQGCEASARSACLPAKQSARAIKHLAHQSGKHSQAKPHRCNTLGICCAYLGSRALFCHS